MSVQSGPSRSDSTCPLDALTSRLCGAGRLDVMSVPRARQCWRVTRGGPHRNFVNYS